MRNFNAWLGEFRSSIADYKYYIDFPKVFANVDALRIELNILNSLIGSRNIEADFENIIERYPETLKCIPILLAKREMDIFAMDEEGAFCYNFVARNYPTSQYKVFMRKTGLFDLMENHLINNLVDYVTGVETGLDSNGRRFLGIDMEDKFLEISKARREELDNLSLRTEYLEKLQKQAKFFEDKDIRVLSEPPIYYGAGLPF